jgi:hypothetical protein
MLEARIAEATVDAYGETRQLSRADLRLSSF